jgi:hypothetical protein
MQPCLCTQLLEQQVRRRPPLPGKQYIVHHLFASPPRAQHNTACAVSAPMQQSACTAPLPRPLRIAPPAVSLHAYARSHNTRGFPSLSLSNTYASARSAQPPVQIHQVRFWTYGNHAYKSVPSPFPCRTRLTHPPQGPSRRIAGGACRGPAGSSPRRSSTMAKLPLCKPPSEPTDTPPPPPPAPPAAQPPLPL